jgi:hypothetical protein
MWDITETIIFFMINITVIGTVAMIALSCILWVVFFLWDAWTFRDIYRSKK